MNTIFTILLCILTLYMHAQTPEKYARTIIEKLSAEEMAGRGYTHNGMDKAANFIADEFKKIGLKNFNASYFQNFEYPIQVIHNVNLSIDGKKLEFGKDFLVSPSAATAKEKLELETFDLSVIDTIFKYEDYDSFYNEIDRLKGKAVYFPQTIFPANYTSNGVSANALYDEIISAVGNNELGEIKTGLQFTENKLTMSLAKNESPTNFFTIKKEVYDSLPKIIEYSIHSEFNKAFKAKNVIGYIAGKDTSKYIMISAHYDHLGKIGEHYFPGANDNASGVAMLLSMAKYYSIKKPNYNIVFVAFAGEEAGLEGSTYFADHSPVPLENIKFLLNFDILGTGEDGIQIVNSKVFTEEYKILQDLNVKQNLLKQIKERGEACNSDHCPLYKKGVPSFFIYTLGGVPYYHDIDDKAETLSLFGFKNILNIFIQFIHQISLS